MTKVSHSFTSPLCTINALWKTLKPEISVNSVNSESGLRITEKEKSMKLSGLAMSQRKRSCLSTSIANSSRTRSLANVVDPAGKGKKSGTDLCHIK